jgi:hypothetical protein
MCKQIKFLDAVFSMLHHTWGNILQLGANPASDCPCTCSALWGSEEI